jgi:hypothetical protein
MDDQVQEPAIESWRTLRNDPVAVARLIEVDPMFDEIEDDRPASPKQIDFLRCLDVRNSNRLTRSQASVLMGRLIDRVECSRYRLRSYLGGRNSAV